MEFQNGKLTLTLHAQSPMIHFQYDQTGATLRASEVKPKLDRYILAQLKKLGEKLPKNCYISETKTALNYKLRIEDKHRGTYVEVKNKRDSLTLPLYYGNLGKNSRDGAFIISNPDLTILCFNQTLQALIVRYLEEFFLSHNFGTMQGKGFGSFVIQTGDKITDCDVVKALKTAGAIGEIYKIDCSEIKIDKRPRSYKPIFEQIQTFYKLTKSGINQKKSETDKDGDKILIDKGYARSALFLYMHKKYKIGNEKAMVKQNNLVDFQVRTERVSGHEHNSHDESHPLHYVRALLGVSSTIFKSPNQTDFVKISSKVIKRFSSPLRFKVVNRIIYIYVIRVDKGILGQSFKFISKNYNHKSERITTPVSFDISDFLAFATWYYNTCLEKLTSTLPKEKERWDERFSANDESEYINYPSEDKKANFNVKLVVNKLPEELHNKQPILLVDKGDQDDTTLPGLNHRANL